MKIHRLRFRNKYRLLVTNGPATDAQGWFLNLYLVGRRTFYFGRRNGSFYLRAMRKGA